MARAAFIISLLLLVVSGCSSPQKSTPALKINSIVVTADEFEQAFKNSPYAVIGTDSARKEFLDNYITRMLILNEAEKKGLDKDAEFLKGVEFFWQQSLIKLVLDRKVKELAAVASVPDDEVRAYYEAHKADDYAGKDLFLVRNSIVWILSNKKQKDAVDAWAKKLRSSSKISIDNAALNIRQ